MFACQILTAKKTNYFFRLLSRLPELGVVGPAPGSS